MDAISICNNALSDIRLQPILNFNDGSTRANLCRDKFPSARDAVLALHPWNFATTHRPIQAQPPGERVTLKWAYQYQLPVSPYCLHVFEAGGGTDARFEVGSDPVHGRLLWSHTGPPLDIKFAWRNEDMSQWSPLAVKIVEKWLASELAPLSSSPRSNRQTLLGEAQGLIAQAGVADAREGKPVIATLGRILLRSRQRGGHFGYRVNEEG